MNGLILESHIEINHLLIWDRGEIPWVGKPAIASISLPLAILTDFQTRLLDIAVCTLLVGLAYLLGSTPSGYWVARWLKGIDIREHGSGSTGATNVLRTVGKLPALGVLIVDIGKGALAIALVRWLLPLGHTRWSAIAVTDSAWSVLAWVTVLAGLAALLGHSKSFWLNFTGGKSVATGLGILLSLDWRVGLATLGVFGLVLAASRIVSLSSISAAIAVSILMVLLNPLWPYRLLALAGGAYVVWRHSSNIQRLLKGTEPRLGQAASAKAS